MSESCHFCGETDVLQEHHIVPRRYDGSDESVNLVTLCPTCHRKIESMYDKRFYDALGVEKATADETVITETCHTVSCTAEADHEIGCTRDSGSLYLCDGHKECRFKDCDKRRVVAIQENRHYASVCEEHSICAEDGCMSTETRVYKAPSADSPSEPFPYRVLCDHHAETTEPWLDDEWLEVWD